MEDITSKCWILALFIRDDGKRFVLGDGAYDFKDSQQHFSANQFVNDVVDVQGNDGVLLAGQVRRAGTQVFDGFIGDQTTQKTDVEQYRRDFIAFFRKNHFYTVVYIFPDSTAIQRRRGFIVEAPEVKELYQLSPQYHVALNFEDLNYYTYSENPEGEETYGESADIVISGSEGGGLEWEKSETGDMQVSGDTKQTTYSGKNLFDLGNSTDGYIVTRDNGTTIHSDNDKSFVDVDFSNNTLTPTRYTTTGWRWLSKQVQLKPNTDYTLGGDMYGYIRVIGLSSLDANTVGTVLCSSASPNETLPKSFNSGQYAYYLLGFYPGVSDYYKDIQIEEGSTATAFEPYVGGQVSPNPDYPQPVNVVSGLQTVTVGGQDLPLNLIGKNLFNYTRADIFERGATWTPTTTGGTLTTTTAWGGVRFKLPVQNGNTITISGSIPANCWAYVTSYTDDTYSTRKTALMFDKTGNFTFTTTVDSDYVLFAILIDRVQTSTITNVQIELGSTATAFEPYSAIELCKIGDYQDYIYKNGADWYLHKATGKTVLNGGENFQVWSVTGTTTYKRFALDMSSVIKAPANNETVGDILSDYFSPVTGTQTYNSVPGVSIMSSGFVAIYDTRYNTEALLPNFKTWLSSTQPSLYYALANSTDTQITDTTLVSQLNAIQAAGKPSSVSATSPNLPAIITMDASGGVVWDAVGAVWEAGTGGSSMNNIMVDSVDAINPIWSVTGPITNPTIENLTTGSSLTFEGSLTASQTLVVDSSNMTAMLNGTNVLRLISGDWLRLDPGLNRIVFSANQSDVNTSKLEWQGVVG